MKQIVFMNNGNGSDVFLCDRISRISPPWIIELIQLSVILFILRFIYISLLSQTSLN